MNFRHLFVSCATSPLFSRNCLEAKHSLNKDTYTSSETSSQCPYQLNSEELKFRTEQGILVQICFKSDCFTGLFRL